MSLNLFSAIEIYSSATENLNPFLIFDWIGNIELDPPVDEWKETRTAPEIVANVAGSFDNLARDRGLNNASTTEIPVGTEWNEIGKFDLEIFPGKYDVLIEYIGFNTMNIWR